jgi:hypothetical protein
MKKNLFFLLFLFILTTSCRDQYERDLSRMTGTWLLDRVVYENELGKPIEITDSEIMLIFNDKEDPDNKAGGKQGTLILGKNVEPIYFKYSFDFSSENVDLSFDQADLERLPVDAIGKVQVYNFKLIDKNMLEFSADYEMVHSSNEVIKNVTYTFVRKQ